MGKKIDLRFGNGLVFPGIIPTDANPETVIVTTSRGKKLPAVMVDVISLRTPNPDGENAGGEPYLRLTRENREFLTARTSYVQGLDVDAHGALITEEQLEMLRGEQITARQSARAQASAPAVGSLADLEAVVAAE